MKKTLTEYQKFKRIMKRMEYKLSQEKEKEQKKANEKH